MILHPRLYGPVMVRRVRIKSIRWSMAIMRLGRERRARLEVRQAYGGPEAHEGEGGRPASVVNDERMAAAVDAVVVLLEAGIRSGLEIEEGHK